MLRSMTGFGQADIAGAGRRISVEIRTVNHRYLDVVFRTPRELQALEGRLREMVQERMERGRVSLVLEWESGGAGQAGAVRLDEALADAYYQALQGLRERYALDGRIEIGTLAALPDLFRSPAESASLEEVWGAVRETTVRALDDLVRMREEEGARLAQDLRQRVEVLRASLARIRERLPERLRETTSAMRERLNKLLGDREFPEDRLAAEVALLADRLDCTEECVRFEIHLDQFLRYLADDAAVGRRLNFLLQELGREANTLGSKGNDAVIAQEVVVIKEELERIREQVQNIE